MKFVRGTKQRGELDVLEGTATLQKHVVKLKDWAVKNYMRLNKDKYESLYMGQNNSKQQYRL